MPTLYSLVSVTWAVFVLSLAGLAASVVVRVRPTWRQLLPLCFVSCCYLVVYSGIGAPWFFGLEYEDAFEYVYAAQVFAADEAAREQVLNPICIDGSARDCAAHASLAHPIGLSVLESWGVRALGFRNSIGTLVSVAFFGLAVVVVFVLLRLWGATLFGSTFGSVALLSTPSFVALGGTSLAEPTAAGLMVCVCGCAALVLRGRGGEDRRWASLVVLSFAACGLCAGLILAPLVKRECMLLPPVVMVGASLWSWLDRSNPNRFVRSGLVAVWVVSGLALGVTVNVAGTSLLDIDAVRPGIYAPFSLRNLAAFAPPYLSSLVSAKYLVFPLLAVCGVAGIRKHPGLGLILPVVVGHVALFLAFSQSYYTETRGEVPYYHFERYTVLVAPLLALCVGVCGDVVWMKVRLAREKLRWTAKGALIGGAMVLAGLGVALGVRDRAWYRSEENTIRREPVVRVCQAIPDQSTVITGVPILFQLYCAKDVRVIAFPELGRAVSKDRVEALGRSENLYVFLELVDLGQGEHRYPKAAQVLRSLECENVEGFGTSLCRVAVGRIP